MIIEHLINYLSQVKGYLEGGESQTLVTYPIDEIIGCLRMWGELHPYKEVLVTAECFREYGKKSLGTVMHEIEQKYFPKPIKKYITIEVESEKESEVDAGMKDIKELVDNMGCPKMKIANSWVEVDNK